MFFIMGIWERRISLILQVQGQAQINRLKERTHAHTHTQKLRIQKIIPLK
jgi:hypothetical protein